MKRIIIKLIIILVYLLFSYNGIASYSISKNRISTIKKINYIRNKSGLNKLYINKALNKSSLNHANYLKLNHTNGHNEKIGKKGFTGKSPSDRAIYSGYTSRTILENLSEGQKNGSESVNGLMSAIYHRFSFLDFSINEIGYGNIANSYVYNMGNSYLHKLCKRKSFNGYGRYYVNICANSSFKIASKLFDKKSNILVRKNPKYVIYPYNNERNVTPVFYDESPDPLPNHKVSGFPISIEFNSDKFNMEKFSLIKFNIQDDNKNLLKLITHKSSKVMQKFNDINKKFTEYQFVIFPYDRLNYGHTYKVSLIYKYQGITSTINWQFSTKKLNNLIKYENKDIKISLNKRYYIYIEPKNRNDRFKSVQISCSYSNNGRVKSDINLYDYNTLSLKISGKMVNKCIVTLDGKKFNLFINK